MKLLHSREENQQGGHQLGCLDSWPYEILPKGVWIGRY